jgi:isopentenyl diphosphate isomerase/L-lactate dehydrogenase-like FMN-dependent dehydrogenase
VSEGKPTVAAAEAVEPADPGSAFTVDDFEEIARAKLPKMVYDYFAGGSGDEWTLAENRQAFARWVFRPRVLVSVAEQDPRTTVLGQPVAFPILLAPTALQAMAHPDGELATARAARALDTLMVLSTSSTTSLEDVAATGVKRWFQLYVMKDHSLTEDLLSRARAAGYGAIVVTVDTPWLGRRHRDERNRFDLPPGVVMAHLPAEETATPDGSGSSLAAYFATGHDADLSWSDLAWLRSAAQLPLVLKGILTAEDALRAVEAGVDGIIVSNHGGRQLDGAPATLDVLSEVVEAAAGRVEVYLDSGVRRGSDALKALALGAQAVLVGRPFLWGLAADGERGVRAVLDTLGADLQLAMALTGCRSIGEIDRSLVAPAAGSRPSGGNA